MRNVDHYIVHSTGVDPGPRSTYAASAPDRELSRAMSRALDYMIEGRRSFVTARDTDSNILYVIPVVEYPGGNVKRFSDALNGHPDIATPDAVTDFIEAMNWTG